ncbi:MAG: hypothetical protein RIC95_08420 [Vicingaceae bacterium]
MKQIFFISFLVLLVNCTTTEKKKELSFEIPETEKEKKVFLKEILEKDQTTREASTQARQEFGYESAEHLEAEKKIWSADKENLEKVFFYLETYGFPERDTYGKDGVAAIWLTLHHLNPPDNHLRREYFPYLYQAWKEGDMTDKEMSFFLN